MTELIIKIRSAVLLNDRLFNSFSKSFFPKFLANFDLDRDFKIL